MMTRTGWWEIPLQTFESLFEYRMVNFFAEDLPSAKLLRFFFIILGTVFVLAFNSTLRTSLLAREGDGVIDYLDVRKKS